MKAVIRNFQSIERADIEIVGLTVLTGESDIGKTAVVRAVAAAWFGAAGDYFIREGETACGVRLDDEDLHIKWIKTTTPTPTLQNSVEVNGVKNTKVGKDHGMLTEPFGIRDLRKEIPDLTVRRPQIGYQHDPLFLLSETDGTRAEVLRILSRADAVAEAQRKARTLLRDLDARRAIREADLEAAKTAAAELESVPTERATLDQLQAAVKTLTGEAGGKTNLAAKLDQLAKLRPRTIPPPPELPAFPAALPRQIEKLEQLLTLTREAQHLGREIDAKERALEALAEQKKETEEQLGICPTCERSFA